MDPKFQVFKANEEFMKAVAPLPLPDGGKLVKELETLATNQAVEVLHAMQTAINGNK